MKTLHKQNQLFLAGTILMIVASFVIGFLIGLETGADYVMEAFK